MDLGSIKPFRFCDLPRELRDKIYDISLCSFSSQPVSALLPVPGTVERAKHSSNISIPCVNKWAQAETGGEYRQIHAEAYSVMVRTNRFVLIRSSGGIPVQALLASICIPIVTDNPQALESFKGFMMLARDLNLFCTVLRDLDQYNQGVSQRLHIILTLGPNMQTSQDAGAFADFYTAKTQEGLLHPFRSHVRGIKGARVRGEVAPQLAKTVERELLEDANTNPEKVLQDLQKAKEVGNRYFREGDLQKASVTWLDGTLEAETLKDEGNPKKVEDALTAINIALRAAPGDAAIIKERAAILEWKAAVA
ncbi:hypothetical protein K491DRAFT_762265 [Lophiostoma macrostomum CBS 122681]|uniref:Uncharacterized protein n=1 Tax=Lophiostoma macrostomum CBS 122681 TaxID=1314788 RepID=A0A6A6SQ49_9PLEO|nr:hypothetical protein K491DRAFT_762265 [Lophiostoma macrostomum CBS 122681]